MDMRTGSLWSKIMIFSLPLMFSNVLQIVFNLSDIAIVGQFAGPIALGAVGSTTILIALVVGLLIGMSQGVNALTALFIGGDDRENEHTAIHCGAFLCAVIGVSVCVLSLILSKPVLELLGTKDELIEGAIIYFRVFMLGCPAMAMFNFGNAVLSATGETKKPLKYLVISGIINVILNLIFVICFHMSVVGVALASIISQYISAVLVLRALITTTEHYKLTVKEIHFDSTIAKRILIISVPTAIQYTLFAIANLFVQSAVNTFDHVIVEGNSAASNADNLVYELLAAFYTACTSFVAQNYGAGLKERVKKAVIITTLYSFSIGLVLGILLYVFDEGFLSLFTGDPAVIAAGTLKLSVMSLSYCISVFMDNAIAAARGLGKTLVPTIIVIMGSVVFRITWIYTVFQHFHTVQGLYLLYPIAWALTAVAAMSYFVIQYKKILN